jgi:hypothetical protein
MFQADHHTHHGEDAKDNADTHAAKNHPGQLDGGFKKVITELDILRVGQRKRSTQQENDKKNDQKNNSFHGVNFNLFFLSGAGFLLFVATKKAT